MQNVPIDLPKSNGKLFCTLSGKKCAVRLLRKCTIRSLAKCTNRPIQEYLKTYLALSAAAACQYVLCDVLSDILENVLIDLMQNVPMELLKII